MRKQQGLTVIDVVVVAATFCALAAVAVPRFALLDEASRLDNVRMLADEVRLTAELSHSIWVSADRPDQLLRDNILVEMTNGYPTSADMAALISRRSMFAFAEDEYRYLSNDQVVADCYVRYLPPAHPLDGPDIKVVVSGC